MNECGKQWIEESDSGHSHPDTVYDQRSPEVLHDDATAAAGNFDGFHKFGKIVANEHHIRALASHIGSRSHGNPNTGLGECRRVIHSVTYHRDATTFVH